MNLDDTIAALATPPGRSGIGIVRLSGPLARRFAERCFLSSHCLQPRKLTLGVIRDPDTSERIDEVLMAWMPAPHSYTCQDVVEVQTHGGGQVLQAVLALALCQGARLAEPGEFTLRAFLNGRIDLAQAEAVQDIILAKTQAALRIAQGQLGGRLSQEVGALRSRLLSVYAQLQASIDFGDDVAERDLVPDLSLALEHLGRLLSGAQQGILYRNGVRVVIIGRPNVGKSRLLNALLGSERAIVTPIAGTTRDTLQESIDLGGIPVELVDTAGLAETADPIEQLGIARAHQALEAADVLLLVVDASIPPSPADQAAAQAANGRSALLVLNKADLVPLYDYDELLPGVEHVATSALTGAGLDSLREAIRQLILRGTMVSDDSTLVSNPRHQGLLARVQQSLLRAQETAAAGGYPDMLAADLQEALNALGEITGETASNELLATIFSTFCIGK
ncbi:MAG: tRNA uridine-5-carboxymethylaminomethyl(34) synthesis GTPase MnmE [Chloroflexi bacterium]|nr:tRNA uridine-5-carboxymethylaminomethyl(34) synthesis GTPase MnmE [Chloroflexota bacterium]